ncbi:unnamed protein product, partial [Mesorhabditis spiculigera]
MLKTTFMLTTLNFLSFAVVSRVIDFPFHFDSYSLEPPTGGSFKETLKYCVSAVCRGVYCCTNDSWRTNCSIYPQPRRSTVSDSAGALIACFVYQKHVELDSLSTGKAEIASQTSEVTKTFTKTAEATSSDITLNPLATATYLPIPKYVNSTGIHFWRRMVGTVAEPDEQYCRGTTWQFLKPGQGITCDGQAMLRSSMDGTYLGVQEMAGMIVGWVATTKNNKCGATLPIRAWQHPKTLDCIYTNTAITRVGSYVSLGIVFYAWPPRSPCFVAGIGCQNPEGLAKCHLDL